MTAVMGTSTNARAPSRGEAQNRYPVMPTTRTSASSAHLQGRAAHTRASRITLMCAQKGAIRTSCPKARTATYSARLQAEAPLTPLYERNLRAGGGAPYET